MGEAKDIINRYKGQLDSLGINSFTPKDCALIEVNYTIENPNDEGLNKQEKERLFNHWNKIKQEIEKT